MGAGVALMIIGLLVGRVDRSPRFGLSSDFWSGSLMGVAIGLMVTGLALLVRQRTLTRR
jgi:hypothetical protein